MKKLILALFAMVLFSCEKPVAVSPTEKPNVLNDFTPQKNDSNISQINC